MPRSVIEDRLRTAVLTAMPLPDLALDAVVAGIPLLTGQNTTPGRVHPHTVDRKDLLQGCRRWQFA